MRYQLDRQEETHDTKRAYNRRAERETIELNETEQHFAVSVLCSAQVRFNLLTPNMF